MKQVKGHNAKAYYKSKANVYITEPKFRKHEVTPGDKLTCNCCGKLVFNLSAPNHTVQAKSVLPYAAGQVL